jgi:peptidoglycan/LPS O-acetylase OafA/YrhL
VLLGLCAAALAWRCALVLAFDAVPERTGVASDTRFDSILFGCALALAENPALDRSALSERIWKWLLFPLGIVGLLLSFIIRDAVFRETLRYTLQGVSLIPIFVCAIRYPNWGPMRPLNLRPLAYLGGLSYSLYLVHQVVLEAVAHRLPEAPGFARGVLSLAVAFGASWVLYQLVEKPCARLRRRLRV